MADPATTARGTPSGLVIPDGYSSMLAFKSNATVSFWEKSVQPPGYDGGELIDITTMHNVLYRTGYPRSLIKIGEIKLKVSYDPNVITQITSLINVNDSATVHYPDGSTLDFFGALLKFEPDALEEGKEPEASVTIGVTNYDPVNHIEVGPKFTNVTGT